MPEIKQDGIKWVDPVISHYDKDGKEVLVYMTCVIDGWMWRISQNGQTYCAGQYKEKKVVDNSPKVHDKPQNRQEDVAKIPNGVQIPKLKPLATKTGGIMQHHHQPGRPLKLGSVHRTTKWRREKQGVLL